MRAHIVFSLCLALAAVACSKPSDERTFTLQGQVLSLDTARKTLVVKHEEIKGFMPAMTMPYEVQDAEALDGLAPGDLINATLVVFSNGAHLTKINKVGDGAARKAAGRSAESDRLVGFRAVEAGRGGARRIVPRSGRQEAPLQRLQGLAGRDDVHLHAVPDRHLLSADGSAFRRAPEDAEGGPGAQGRAARDRQLRSGHRYAGRAHEAREDAERRPVALDVPHRRPRRGRSIRLAVRRVGRPLAQPTSATSRTTCGPRSSTPTASW